MFQLFDRIGYGRVGGEARALFKGGVTESDPPVIPRVAVLSWDVRGFYAKIDHPSWYREIQELGALPPEPPARERNEFDIRPTLPSFCHYFFTPFKIVSMPGSGIDKVPYLNPRPCASFFMADAKMAIW